MSNPPSSARSRAGRTALFGALLSGLFWSCGNDADNQTTATNKEEDTAANGSSNDASAPPPQATNPRDAGSQGGSSGGASAPPSDDAAPPLAVSPACQRCVEDQCGSELEACACTELIQCTLESDCLNGSNQTEIITCALASCGQLLPADFEASALLVFALAGCIEAECLATCS